MKLHLKKSATAALIIIIAVFASCRVSRDIQAPDTATPSSFRNAPANADTVSMATVPWQSFFTDVSLKALIKEALKHNNDLLSALKTIDAAELAFKQAKLQNLPSVGAAINVSDARPSDNSINHISLNQALHETNLTDYTVGASLSWEADIWGKIRSQKLESLGSYLASAEAKKALQTRIISDIAKGYYNLLMLDDQLDIARKNMELTENTVRLATIQYQAGTATSVGIEQAKAQQLTAAALIPQLEQQIVLQETIIGILTGHYSAKVERHAHMDSIAIPDKIGLALPVTVLRQRPDIRQAEFELLQANAKVGYTKSAMYPSLTINAQGGLDAIKAGNWFNMPASLFGMVAGGITEPLFDKKRLATQYQVAKLNRDKTVLNFRQSVLRGYGEVSDALVQIDKLKTRQDAIADRTGELTLALQHTMVLFQSGTTTYLEVIITERDLLRSELELASIKKDRLNAYVDLYRSLGGGWN